MLVDVPGSTTTQAVPYSRCAAGVLTTLSVPTSCGLSTSSGTGVDRRFSVGLWGSLLGLSGGVEHGGDLVGWGGWGKVPTLSVVAAEGA